METININGEEYVKKSELDNALSNIMTDSAKVDGLQYVCIKTYSAGVHCGYLKERNGKEVQLVIARRIWKWSGAFTLSELAVNGVENPGECKSSCTVPRIYLTEAIEIIPMTAEAKKSIEGVKAYDCNN